MRSFLARLRSAGWRLSAPAVTAPRNVRHCIVGTPPGGEEPTCLFYVFGGPDAVGVDDLWRLVGDANRARAARPVMCVGRYVSLTPTARRTAARLQVRVLRLSD